MDDVTLPIRSVVIAAFGVLLIARGARVRFGGSRDWLQINRASSLPLFTRNAPFLLIPGGLLFVIGAIFAGLPSSQEWSGLKTVLGISAVVLLPTLLVASSRPPRWLMPRWFRDELDGAGLPSDRFDRSVLVISIVAACFVVIAFLSFVLVPQN